MLFYKSVAWMLMLLCLGVQPLQAQRSLTGRAVKIVDGDTFDLLAGGTIYRIRLAGIDCPERGQPYYREAKDALGSWCALGTLKVIYSSKDRNGRIVGEVYTAGGNHINKKLLEEGVAWHYTKYSSDRSLAEAERRARQERRGLWKESNPMAPWDWRRRGRK